MSKKNKHSKDFINFYRTKRKKIPAWAKDWQKEALAVWEAYVTGRLNLEILPLPPLWCPGCNTISEFQAMPPKCCVCGQVPILDSHR